MKKQDIPQDKSHLENFTREVFYAKNEKGEYEAGLSKGWDVKTEALENAWKDIDERTAEALHLVKSGEKSPIYYFMELNLMDIPTLSAYTGFWSFFIKRHFKPSVFKKLNDDKLQKYADAFEITLKELKEFGTENH
jgi:hypothetical protein